MGQVDKEGRVILTAGDNATPLNRALELIDFSAQEGLGHGITPEDFSILTLQLFAGRLCAKRADEFGCFRVDWSQRKFLRYFISRKSVGEGKSVSGRVDLGGW